MRLEIDGKTVGVKLCISRLNEQLVAGLPDRALDLLEIAALVYGTDAAVNRGGSADQQMGTKWHRRFDVEVPVRDRAFWVSNDVAVTLEETLMFLSGDRFVFRFTQKGDPEAERSRFFKFDDESAWRATRVLMFSGGLDSFAGALEEIAEQGRRVALVSHFSASKIAPVQRSLQRALAENFGPDCCRHIPVQVQMTGRGLKEGTHRSRSFLFAVLGAIAARAFDLNRVSFYENGVVSLNLPPVGNVLGTRATRTTHPQTLARFSGFLNKVFENGTRIDNPFFWRTKTDVVESIARLNMGNQIAHMRSCADVHNQTKQYVHCGRCSQCIDRRFAVLAAGLERFDPEEAYRVALLDGVRESVIDREIALSYLRNAQAFEDMRAADLERYFPAVLDAASYLDNPANTALELITQLLRRHGKSVAGVMRDTLTKRDAESFPDGSLPKLYGDTQRHVVLPSIEASTALPVRDGTSVLVFEIDVGKRRVDIDGRIAIERNAAADLLIQLAKAWLLSAGQGLNPLDFSCINAKDLARRLGLEGDEAVRRRINRARAFLKQRFESSGLGVAGCDELIENIHGYGYRLAPDRVTVRKHPEAK